MKRIWCKEIRKWFQKHNSQIPSENAEQPYLDYLKIDFLI